MSWDSVCDSVCPIARSLAVVGDRWTLLILRELTMGVHRFEALQAQTEMSPHLLTKRLRRLEKDGVIERRIYQERPVRHEYHATAKGKELDPILLMLRSWQRKWDGDKPAGEPAVHLVHKVTGKTIDHLSQTPSGGVGFTFDDLVGTVGPTFKLERDARIDAFEELVKPKAKRSAARKT